MAQHFFGAKFKLEDFCLFSKKTYSLVNQSEENQEEYLQENKSCRCGILIRGDDGSALQNYRPLHLFSKDPGESSREGEERKLN